MRAEFYGIELDGKWRVYQHGAPRVDVSLVGDYTHARNMDAGQPLPRISPLRATIAVDYGYGPFAARAEMEHAWALNRVPEDDFPTASDPRLGVMLTYKFNVGATNWLAYVRWDNLTNQDIRYASSVVRDIAPEGVRSVMVGLRTTF